MHQADPDTNIGTRRLVCTTPWRASQDQMQRAHTLANWFDCPFVKRQDRSILQLCADERVDTVLVADNVPKVYHQTAPETPVFFHPGMAMMRIQNMARGESDRLVKAAGITPGNVVVDCTLGAGSDALVLALAVGPQGRVLACEVETVLERLFAYAKSQQFAPYVELAGLSLRIDTVQMHHLEFLRGMPDDSADVVYFDPMFRLESIGRSANMDAMRSLTNPAPLSGESIAEAKRVARQAVVVKERPDSGEFRRLGLTPDKPRARVAYGVWRREAGTI